MREATVHAPTVPRSRADGAVPSATKHTLEGMEKNRFLGRGSGIESRRVAVASGVG